MKFFLLDMVTSSRAQDYTPLQLQELIEHFAQGTYDIRSTKFISLCCDVIKRAEISKRNGDQQVLIHGRCTEVCYAVSGLSVYRSEKVALLSFVPLTLKKQESARSCNHKAPCVRHDNNDGFLFYKRKDA